MSVNLSDSDANSIAQIETVNYEISLSQLRLKVGELQREEEDLMYRLADVRASLHEMRSKITNILSKKSPIAKIPDDILCEIFKHCESKHRSFPFQSRLSLVSRRWWNIMCTPSLWSDLELGSSNLRSDSTIEKTRVVLKRSGNTPLRISLSYFPTTWALLRPHLHRLCFLYIYFKGKDEGVVHEVITRAPKLRYLRINGVTRLDESFRTNCDSVPSDSLKTLSLFNYLHVSGIHFPALTTLNILYSALRIPLSRISDVVQSFPSLITLTLRLVPTIYDAERLRPIKIPSLKHLRVQFSHESRDVLNVIACFSTPALESLSLSGSMPENGSISPSRLQFFLDSYPNLRTLSIRNGNYPSLLATLFPDIWSLVVTRDTSPGGISKLFPEIDKVVPETSLWPRLKEVTVQPVDANSFDPLYRMLLFRQAIGSPLSKLHLVCPIGSDVDWTYQLRRMTDVDVTFTDALSFGDV